MTTTEKLTPRQLTAIEKMITDVRDTYDVEVSSLRDFDISYRDEARPGRGHDIVLNRVDADHVVTAHIDVYGFTSLSVGEVIWEHSSADEECDCTPCMAAREDDEL